MSRNAAAMFFKSLPKSFTANGHFFFLFFLQLVLGVRAIPNLFVSKPGWLDPWVNIGYGQAWPDKSFSFSYYKESRILNILFQSFLSFFDSWERLVLQSATASFICILTGVIISRYFVGVDSNNRRLIAGIYSLFLFFCFLNWGDRSGGVDYYNQLGIGFLLFFTLLTFRITVVPKDKYFFLLGLISYLTAMEVPQSFPLLLICIFFLFIFQSKKSLRGFFTRLILISFGCSAAVISQGVLLLVFGQTPMRLVAGPHYLFNSVFNSETLNSWQSRTSTSQLQKLTHILFFELLFVLLFLFIAVTSAIRKHLSVNDVFIKILISSIALFFAISWYMELNGKSFLLRTDYGFASCLVLTQITYLTYIGRIASQLPVKTFVRYSFLFLMTLGPLLFIYIDVDALNVFLWFIFALLIYTFTARLRSLFFLGVIVLISGTLVVGASSGSQFLLCQNDRLRAQQELFDAAREVDRFGKRGSQVIAIPVKSAEGFVRICGELLPISDYVHSLSQMGFPGIVGFGSLPADFFKIYGLKESYAASGLVTFDGDLRLAGRCTWLISFTENQNQNEKAQIQSITNMNLIRSCYD
jgi:hypothetical protein